MKLVLNICKLGTSSGLNIPTPYVQNAFTSRFNSTLFGCVFYSLKVFLLKIHTYMHKYGIDLMQVRTREFESSARTRTRE